MSDIKPIEIEGKRWLYQERITDGVSTVSFDGGESWSENMAQAYRSARDAKKLQPETPDRVQGLTDEAAAVVVELLSHIRALRPGERIEVVHTGASIQVQRMRAVAAFRPSALEDVGIEAADEGER